MSQFTLPTSIYHSAAAGNDGYEQIGIASYSNAAQGLTQVHIKTDVPFNTPGVMAMIEAVGYNYGQGQAIRCAWTFYQWNNTLYRTSFETCYPGMTPTRVYISGDGYVCLQAAVSSTYFIGFTLNAYSGNPATPGTKIRINQINASTISGNFY